MAQTEATRDSRIIQTARDAARSVYDMLVESVEETERTATWKTADLSTSEMVYQVPVYTGIAGIALFLADYGRAFFDNRAIVLATLPGFVRPFGNYCIGRVAKSRR